MKKILLFLTIFLSINSFAQDDEPDWNYDYNQPISPFFPQTLILFADDYMVTQNTFYELNWTANNLRKLISANLRLRYNEEDSSQKDGVSIDVYKSLSGSTIYKLVIKYNIFLYYNRYIVSSIEITGEKSPLINLFVALYKADYKISESKSKTFVKRFAQENTTLNLNENKITIKNLLFKSISEFKLDFEKRKNKYVFEESKLAR